VASTRPIGGRWRPTRPERETESGAREWAFARAGRSDPQLPTKIDSDLVAQWADLGVTVEADDDEEAIGVWRINWQSWMAFLRCETQWRAVAMAVGEGSRLIWLGIDYAIGEARLCPPQSRRGAPLFDDICVMEHAALEAMGEIDE
jgi:hypothetical protein